MRARAMHDLSIDLTLAVNYLPACACALQSVVLSFSLCALHSVKLLSALVPVCLVLVLNRANPVSTRIFDASAVLFSIFFSHCVAAMQEFGANGVHLWPSVYLVLSLEWPFTCLYFLVRPPAHRDHLRIHFALACFRVSCLAFLYRPDSTEHRLLRVGRDLVFAGLCLVWTYIVGLYRRRLTHQPTESATFFSIYFWPVLYVQAYAACTYAFIAFAVIVLQLRQAESTGYPGGGPAIACIEETATAAMAAANHERPKSVIRQQVTSQPQQPQQQQQQFTQKAQVLHCIDEDPEYDQNLELDDDQIILRQALLSACQGSPV